MLPEDFVKSVAVSGPFVGRTPGANERIVAGQNKARILASVTVGNSICKTVDLEPGPEGGIRLVLHIHRSV